MSKQAIDGAQRANAFRLDPYSITIVGLDTDDGPSHPLYDSRVRLPLNQGLVENIAQYGVLQTIGVTKEDDGRIVVVYGRQRVRAAREVARRLREAGKVAEAEAITVPCLTPLKGWTDAELASAMTSENEIRTGDDVLVRAEKAAHLNKLWGGGNAARTQVARAMGVGAGTIDALLALHAADPGVHKAVKDGLSAGAALQIAQLPRADQADAAAKALAEGTTVDEVREKVKTSKAGGDEAKTPALSRASLRRLAVAEETDAVLGHLTPREILALALGQRKPGTVKGLVALLRGEKGGAA